MELLRADNLSFRYGAADTLRGVSLGLQAGQKLGFVGPNGSGKSTLLRLLAGELTPEEGRVLRAPGLRVGRLGGAFRAGRTLWEVSEGALAHVRSLEKALREEEARLSAREDRLAAYGDVFEAFEAAGGYRAEEALRATLAAFGFDEARYNQKVSTLSGGERARLALAVLLAEGTDVLLLDEPSNGLDLTTRRVLSRVLAKTKSAFVLASHDRALLDAVCTHTAWLEQGRLSLYRGGYADMLEQRNQAFRTAEKRNRAREKERSRLLQSRAGMAGWNTPTAARGRKALERRISTLAGENTPSTKPAELRLETERVRGTLLVAKNLSKTYDGREVVRDASLRISAGDKLALVGPNGSGKSTFLALLTGELESDNPKSRLEWGKETKVAVFDQETRGLEGDLTLLDQLTRYVSELRAQGLLSLVGFRREDWGNLPVELSEGQRARAGLALLMASEANLLILDEPSEGLDVVTTETLEGALRGTEAAFVLVSHDERLIEGVAERVLTLDGGALKEFRGGLAGYDSGTLRLEVERAVERSEASEAEETPEDALERLELERLELDRRLLDPFGLSEREVERLGRRYREVLDALSLLYDARLEPPGPRYRVREGVVEVWGDEEGLTVPFGSNAGLSVTLILPTGQEGRVGHFVLTEPEDARLLSWARDRAINAVARVAFERLGVRALQLQTSYDLSRSHFRAAGGEWWTLSREVYERAEGYGARPTRRVRRLELHPSWPDWVAYRRSLKRRAEAE